jgi:hypothetical protein
MTGSMQESFRSKKYYTKNKFQIKRVKTIEGKQTAKLPQSSTKAFRNIYKGKEKSEDLSYTSPLPTSS